MTLHLESVDGRLSTRGELHLRLPLPKLDAESAVDAAAADGAHGGVGAHEELLALDASLVNGTLSAAFASFDVAAAVDAATTSLRNASGVLVRRLVGLSLVRRSLIALPCRRSVD